MAAKEPGHQHQRAAVAIADEAQERLGRKAQEQGSVGTTELGRAQVGGDVCPVVAGNDEGLAIVLYEGAQSPADS